MPTAAEQKFIKQQGKRFALALAAATRVVMLHPRLIGAIRLRDAMAYHAALRGLGFSRTFTPPKAAGEINGAILPIIHDTIAMATDAAAAAVGRD